MAYLLDTTILARLANATDAQHVVAARSVLELHRRGEVLHMTPQVLIEFRNVATRPVAVNGLGLSAADAEAQAGTFEKRFPLLVALVISHATNSGQWVCWRQPLTLVPEMTPCVDTDLAP